MDLEGSLNSILAAVSAGKSLGGLVFECWGCGGFEEIAWTIIVDSASRVMRYWVGHSDCVCKDLVGPFIDQGTSMCSRSWGG